jgi:hypothetical protein
VSDHETRQVLDVSPLRVEIIKVCPNRVQADRLRECLWPLLAPVVAGTGELGLSYVDTAHLAHIAHRDSAGLSAIGGNQGPFPAHSPGEGFADRTLHTAWLELNPPIILGNQRALVISHHVPWHTARDENGQGKPDL